MRSIQTHSNAGFRNGFQPPSLPPGIVHHGYDRARDLPRLVPIWPEDLADMTLDGRARLVKRLATLLRRERQRGLAGDWCYDLVRHWQLVVAYRAEHQAWRVARAAGQ